MFYAKSLSLGVLAASLIHLVSIPAVAQPKTLYGTLDAKARVFRFVIQVDKDGGAKLKSLDEGNREFKLFPFSMDKDVLLFELSASKASFESKYDAKSESYQGKWKQAGNELDLSFRVVNEIPEDPTKEIWEGELSLPGQKLALRFRVYDRKKHSVLMDSPDQRAGGFSGSVESKDNETVFDIPAIRGKFKGKVSDDKQTLKGAWSQNGVEFPIELKRVAKDKIKKDASAPKRPQTPKAPFPYSSEDVSITNKSANLTLAATLTIPNQGSAFPCAILISGSGAQDRNETLMDHQPFWVLADHLGRNGIACLRFDDRGTAKSTGDHSTATSADFATDVSAIVDFLKTHPKIDGKKIGLCGHSEGGLIAPIVAVDRDDVAFIVMLAGPGVNGEKILKNQIQLIMKASGASEKDIEVASSLQGQLIDLVKADKEISDKSVGEIVDKLIQKHPEQEKDKDQILTNAKAGAKRLSSPWMKYFLSYEPGPTLAKVKCPVLVLNGSKDTQVDPKLNFPAIKKSFESAKKTNYEMMLLQDLNHLFQKCETGAIDEYQKIEETFSAEALNAISTWISKTAG